MTRAERDHDADADPGGPPAGGGGLTEDPGRAPDAAPPAPTTPEELDSETPPVGTGIPDDTVAGFGEPPPDQPDAL